MYFEYFGLKKNPFRITPDEDFIYFMEGHKNSYAYLKYTAWANDGFMLLTGEIGTGKTILLKKLNKDLAGSIKIINISQTQLELDDLLRVLLFELTQSFEAASRAELIIRIKQNLIKRKTEDEKILLILDEAQNLNRECLEEIRLLADEMCDGENLINVILAGQPELERSIDNQGMEQLKQRIRITYRLTALKERDVESYVDFRSFIGYGNRPLVPCVDSLLRAQYSQKDALNYQRLFKVGASSALYKSTHGVPRLINALCETSLVLAYGLGVKEVNHKLVSQAVDELGWIANESDDDFSSINAKSLDHEHIMSIEVFSDGKIIKIVGVDHLPFTIGRNDENDLVLVNKTVSKKHAYLDRQNDALIIKDCESTNGVKINGLKVVAHVISNGEIAQVGRYKLRFLVNEAIEQEAPEEGDTVNTLQITR